VTEDTAFDGDNETSSPSALQVGQIVDVEGSMGSDGSREALEIAVEDDEPERSITARIESVSPGDSITPLGGTIRVTGSTEFDDDEELTGGHYTPSCLK